MINLWLATPGRDEAQDLARRELQQREYDAAKPPLLNRLITWSLNKIDELINQAANHLPGGRTGLVLLVALVLALVTVVIVRLQPTTTGRRVGGAFDAGPALSADGHRRLAEQAASENRYGEAVRERLRAIVRDLESRGVLDSRPGRTAGEVARDASAAVPALAEQLRRGALLFDEIWYGGRRADASSYAVLVDLDRRVSASALVHT